MGKSNNREVYQICKNLRRWKTRCCFYPKVYAEFAQLEVNPRISYSADILGLKWTHLKRFEKQER